MAILKTVAVQYGSIALFTSILHNVFLLYHVETFVSIYRIDKTSFWLGETVFLIWNSCNDPLFGWLSDKKYLSNDRGAGGINTDIILGRLKALTWNGPLFALAFLAFWIGWTYPALQFVICLCLYDTFLTMIDLHHSALMADMALSADSRTSLNFYSSMFSAVGSLSVFVSYTVWDRDNIQTFQMYCMAVSAVAIAGFLYTTRSLQKIYTSISKSQKDGDLSKVSSVSCLTDLQDGVGFCDNEKSQYTDEDEKKALKRFLRDLSGHKNFLWFAGMNIVQVFHCHFNSNFFPLFLESLLGDDVPQLVCSLILGISFVAPHLNNLYFLSLCRRFGVYTVIRGLFFLKMFISCLMAVMGPGHLWLLCIFIASNRVFTEGTCKLLSLVISDLVDEDFVLHHRQQAVSALMFGTAAFVAKPGQTLAPLLGTWLLAVYTGHDVFQSGNSEGSIKMNLQSMDYVSQQVYRLGVFHMLVYVPIICGGLQLLAWSRFTLRDKRLEWVKSVRAGIQYTTV